MAGQALIITGTTGSGKTTSCKAFTEAAEDLWFHFGVDLFLGTVVPRKFVDGGPRDHEGVHMVPDDPSDPEGARHMALGHHGMTMIETFHAMAATAVRSGARLVLDHVTTLDPPLLADCLAKFRGIDVFFVCLRPPEDIIPQRIDERLESIINALGREHATRTNRNTKLVSRYMSTQLARHDCYDLVIDTNANPPQQVAQKILAAMAERKGAAFAELTRRLDASEPPFA